jgi:hypothetical protein
MRDQNTDPTIPTPSTEAPDVLTLVLDQLEQHLNHQLATQSDVAPTIAVLHTDGQFVVHEVPDLLDNDEPVAIQNDPSVRVIASSRSGYRYVTDIGVEERGEFSHEEVAARAERVDRVITLMAITPHDRRLRVLPIEQVAPSSWTLSDRFAPDTRDFVPWVTLADVATHPLRA